MAKLKNGIFGPILGKLGPLVGASWKKTYYLRALPKKKKNSSKTAAQLANEQKFKFVTEWLVPFHPFVTVGFKEITGNRTEINEAFSFNYKNAVTGCYPNLGVDYSKVLLSKGSLPGLTGLTAQLKTPGELELQWASDQVPHASYDDQLLVVLFCPELKMTDGFIGGTKRADLSCRFKFNPKMKGKVLEVYVGLVSLNAKKSADSLYLGQL